MPPKVTNRVDNPDTTDVDWGSMPVNDGFGHSSADATSVEVKPATKAPADDRNMEWSNRRRMAWISLIAMLLTTVALLFVVPVPRLEALGGIIDMFYIAMTSIVGAFIGFQAWWNVKRGSKG
ncbi:MAG: hypothetical protein DDT26_00668 [Dehalococcoidia bacterium]|nr:hypothetical protein [Chloroflexota bacterium]